MTPAPTTATHNYKVGVGLQYEIDPAVLLRTEIERYRVKEAPGNHGIVNTWSISLVFPFGRQAQDVRPGQPRARRHGGVRPACDNAPGADRGARCVRPGLATRGGADDG